MPGRAVPPEYGVWFEAGAAFMCLAGSHSALMLAAASIRLQLPPPGSAARRSLRRSVAQGTRNGSLWRANVGWGVPQASF